MPSTDDDILEMFVLEAQEHISTLEKDLLRLQYCIDDNEVINSVFRSVHSIKGTAGFSGLDNISKISHAMENIMSLVRDGKLAINDEILSALVDGMDKLHTMIDEIDNSESIDASEETKTLEKLLKNAGLKGLIPQAFSTKLTLGNNLELLKQFSLDPISLTSALENNDFIYKIDFFLNKDVKSYGISLFDLFKDICDMGDYIDSYTDISPINNIEDSLGNDISCSILLATQMMPNLIMGAFSIPQNQVTNVTELIQQCLSDSEAAEAVTTACSQNITEHNSINIQKNPKPNQENSEKFHKKSEENIRVSVPLLDDLMNLAGEMVLNRNQLLLLGDEAKESMPKLSTIIQNINLVTSEIQEKIMQTRVQEVGTIFNKFNRVIRHLSKKLGKEIEIKIKGAEVELDRSIIEALSDPLTHIVRNAADHAIELPEDRIAAGKPKCGLIQLTAKHSSGQVYIQIEDDGAGLDSEKLKSKAIEKGLITTNEADKLTQQQSFSLIFNPGFSTVQEVSDISGRGVGMDVVRLNVEKMGGTIELFSKKGKGTKILLKLPLTLAIIPALIIKEAEHYYAVPQMTLEEVVVLNENETLERIEGNPIFKLRNELLPLISLKKLLELKNTSNIKEEALSSLSFTQEEALEIQNKKYNILVLETDKQRFGLIVEKAQDTEEIVVKPLSSYLKQSECYSGKTIMGNGQIAMILDGIYIAEIAKLKFQSLGLSSNASDKIDKTNLIPHHENQKLLIFENSPGERLAIDLSMISRIDKIKNEEIKSVGENEYLTHNDNSIKIIHLDRYMSINKNNANSNNSFVIIPNLVKEPIGIVVSKLVDIVQCNVNLDKTTVTGECIFGSTVIFDQLTILIDLYKLFEAVDSNYGKELKNNNQSLAGKRILFAENTPFFRTVTTQFLTELGLDIDTANDGKDAWEKINNNPYDMLLTDIEMPYMDGIELANNIRKTDSLKNIPIVALTSLDYNLNIQNAQFDAYQKKLDKIELKKTINNLLTDISNN